MKNLLSPLIVFFALAAFAWDVEHDEVAQLTGEFLPAEIRAQFDFDDFNTLISNCHYPDVIEWPMEGGVRRYHTLDELGEKVGPVDKEIFRSQGFVGDDFHSERARALVMGLMARAFANGEHAKAAFYASVLTHQVADESALNHPPLLQFVQYSRYPGIDLGLRKVEGGAKNVFGFRSDGYIVHRVREKLRGYVPKAPADDFQTCVVQMVAASVAQGDYAARYEGLIGFGPIPEAEEALAELVAMQVRVLTDMIWTAWKFRSPEAALPGPDFDKACHQQQMAIMKTLDPAKQSVFARVFDRSRDPKNPKGVVGIVCEPYGMFAESETPYMGRMVGAMCAGTLRKAGWAVRGISYFAAERDGLPDPKEVPTVIAFTGGTGYMCTDMSDAMASRVKAYREAGGRLILVGGADQKDVSGFGDAIRMRPNGEVPVTAKWFNLEMGDALKMSVLGAKSLPRLGNTRTKFVRNPNINGFCKAVCPVEIVPKSDIEPLFSLDNGRETFVVGARRANVTWLPMYVLAQYLLAWDDPHLDYSDLTLDSYGEKVLLDVMESAGTTGAETASCCEVKNGSVTCVRHVPGLEVGFRCWAPEGLADGEGSVYVFLEWDVKDIVPALKPLMEKGTIPRGLCVSFNACGLAAGGDAPQFKRGMRASTFDQPGPEYPSAIADEIIPAAEKLLDVRASRSPDLHFITGGSSGGIAAWNACWYRNDFFRRCWCNSPTFSNLRGGNQLMPLVRKCETRPIRVYVTVGTDEPDYFFGDSYLVAEDAVSALRFAGYEVRYDRFPHEGHCAKYHDPVFLGQVLTWLFEDWKTKSVAVATDPIRVRDAVVKGSEWQECNFAMPASVTEVRSTDRSRVYSVSPANRFVMTERVKHDGTRDQLNRLAPLESAWNATRVGGTALALAADDRVWVATELGVQGVVSFGLTDVILPLPGDLPCDNVALVGTNLYASSGERVFHRYVKTGAADPSKVEPPRTPGYGDGFWYSREHEPAGGMAELLGSYVTAGRIAGVVSVLSDNDYNETYDCAGWADYGAGNKGRMTPDNLFAIFSMTKTFTGAAIMCAIDEGKLSLDDEVAKYLPEFADVKLNDGSKPKRPLTLRDLASHVTGFRGGTGVVNRDLPLREVARRLAAQPLEFQPGETFSYGNAWICTAAACLEIAVGEPYERYLQRKILDPLGMKDTTFVPNEEQLTRLVKAYNSDDTTIRPAKDGCTPQLEFPKQAKIYPAASGGLFSTPRDMIRFSQMLAHHGTWKDKTIISRKTFDTVFAVKQTPAEIDAPYSVGSWIYGDWFGHEGAMRTDQRANLKTGHSRVFFIQTENAAGSAFFQLKRDWHFEADKIQRTPPTVFGN